MGQCSCTKRHVVDPEPSISPVRTIQTIPLGQSPQYANQTKTQVADQHFGQKKKGGIMYHMQV